MKKKPALDFSPEFWDKAVDLPFITLDLIHDAIEQVANLKLSVDRQERFALKNLLALSQRLENENKPVETASEEDLKRKHLLIDLKYEQSDFFIMDSEDLPYLKNDIASMAHPIFALKAGDTRTIEYQLLKRDSEIDKVIIRPGAELGRATIFDKDIWIFVCSKLMQAKFDGKQIKKTVEFTSSEYFQKTNRGRGGNQYNQLKDALNRLAGTRIETNIKTGGERISQGFGLIDAWKITEKGRNEAPLKVLVTLPDWLYNSIEAKEVLQISKEYFRLRKALDRRIYEIARKHCGRQKKWKIKLSVLREKTGTTSNIHSFRHSIKSLVKANVLPDYSIEYDPIDDFVIFHNNKFDLIEEEENNENKG